MILRNYKYQFDLYLEKRMQLKQKKIKITRYLKNLYELILFIIKYVNPSNKNIMIFKFTTRLPAINEMGKKYIEISIIDKRKFFLITF